MTKEEYDKKYREVLEKNGRITETLGAFSDLVPDLAHIEEQKVDERGKITKFIGCHAWFKVHTDRELHNDCTELKATYMATLKFVLKHPILFSPLFFIRNDIVDWAYELYDKRLRRHAIPVTHFSPMCREIIRLADAHDDYRIKGLIKCVALFLQTSSSYYVRAQDMLWELRKDKDIIRVLQLGLERDREGTSRINHFVKAARYALKIPKVRNITKTYLNSLDYNQFAYDEDDIYWAFRKEPYDTFGLSPEERKEYVKKVDKRKGNYILHENMF